MIAFPASEWYAEASVVSLSFVFFPSAGGLEKTKTKSVIPAVILLIFACHLVGSS